MAHGGRREGAGRRKGTPNKASLARQEQVEATGYTPLDYMLQVMRDKKASQSRRDQMARAAAPYVHPKLAAMPLAGNGDSPMDVDLTRLTDEQLTTLESIFGPLCEFEDHEAQA